MIARDLPKTVVIIGAGAAGLFAARGLRKLGVDNITLLEKEAIVGGKCSTYYDQTHPGLVTERGACAVALNYGQVLDAIEEKKIKIEKLLPAQLNSIAALQALEQMSHGEKIQFIAKLSAELVQFNKAVKAYNHARDNQLHLPEDLELPFADYAKKHGLEKMNALLKPFVSGFGYGDMDTCATHSILEYMGYCTLPAIAAGTKLERTSLVSIQNGYQHLMEQIASDFNVITSVTVNQIDRDDKITVHYTEKNTKKQLTADALILAISPLHWQGLNMPLTNLERACIKQITYYRYPIAVCRIKSFPPNEVYVSEALDQNHFGHVAFISTRDARLNPADGRLCTVYINWPEITSSQEKNTFTEATLREIQSEEAQRITAVIVDDLQRKFNIPATDIKIEEIKIWEDYFSSLPWQTRLALEKEQFNPSTKTIYTGPYALGGFEDVACVANQATGVINRCFHAPHFYLNASKKEVKRTFEFFTQPREKPYTDAAPQPEPQQEKETSQQACVFPCSLL